MDVEGADGAEPVAAPSASEASASAAPAAAASSSSAPRQRWADVPLWDQWEVPIERRVEELWEYPDTQILESPSMPTEQENTEPTPELLDLLCLMTKANRLGRGNFVWLGWNASPSGSDTPKRAQSIANGSQLIAVTARGARWMLNRFEVRCMFTGSHHCFASLISTPFNALSAPSPLLHKELSLSPLSHMQVFPVHASP